MRKGKKQLAEEFAEMTAELSGYLEVISQPNGFAKLTIEGRKMVLSLLLSAIVPADGHIRDTEISRLQLQLQSRFALDSSKASQFAFLAKQMMKPETAEHIAASLAELLGMEDRCKVLFALWDLAMCDHELHQYEEDLIYRIADAASVPRRLVIEQQRRAGATWSAPAKSR
jgi:uncharacterized tellurite resistance protein B-like protein